MSTLLEIGDDLTALLELIDESPDGELSPEMEQSLEAWFAELAEARDEKLDNYGGLLRDLTLRIAARREEKERLAKRVQAGENLIGKLKDRLKLFFELQGLAKVETRRYTISVQKNGGVQPCEVTVPASQLPERFQQIEVAVKTDVLRAALVAGEEIEGARLLPRGSHVRVM